MTSNAGYTSEYVDYSTGHRIKTLGWLTCPVSTAEEEAVLPTLAVFSEPEMTCELELVVHSESDGNPQVSGQRFVSLRSQGSSKPSVATFEDIRIKRAGRYVIEVRCVADPEVNVLADYPLEIGEN